MMPGKVGRPRTPQVPPELQMLTTGQAAMLMGVRPSTIQRWCDSGRLECIVTMGGHRRVKRTDILALAARKGRRAA